MNVAYNFYFKIHVVFKSKEDWFSNVYHSSQPPDSKNTFSPNSSNQNDLKKIKMGYIHFFSSTCGQNMSLYGQKKCAQKIKTQQINLKIINLVF